MISVIIPTRNRASYLEDTVESILKQTLCPDLFEIIVIDNDSTDNTRVVIDKLNRHYDNRIKYFFEGNPGLHVGRHRGAEVARGEILVYADDDIIAFPSWLESIKNTFNDTNVVLVGGKNSPKWEGVLPDWMNLFKSETGYGWTIGYLSLLDFGNSIKEIPAQYVFGCNFSIRKSVLFECGGFHPDAMPQELIRYRGDGETALSLSIMEKKYKTIYEPKASIYHRVPSERLTIDYFCRRAFNQGISDSFTEIRRKHGLPNELPQPNFSLWINFKKKVKSFIFRSGKTSNRHPIVKQVKKSHEEGISYHRKEVAKDPELLKYILKQNYFKESSK